MPSTQLRPVIAGIHAAPPRVVYVFAGAGSLALHWLHAVPGSSRTLLEARDCYAPRALAAILGEPPAQAVSIATAQAMATWAYEHAATLADEPWPLFGLACTAAIATDRARRGADRACVAVFGSGLAQAYELTMAKGRRTRAQQETLTSRLVILALARVCGAGALPLELLPDETLVEL